VPTFVVRLLVTVIQLYSLVILVRIILSWIPNVDRNNQIIRLLYQITDPVLKPVRRVIPPIGMIDISPLVALVLLSAVERALVGSLGY